MANPGDFCIDIGERDGSGIPNIFHVWREQGWKEPIITEPDEPDRIVLLLSLLKNESSDKGTKTTSDRITILVHITDHASVICSDIS